MPKFSLILFVSLSAVLSPAASFYNGQAARAVIGQNAFTDGYVPPPGISNILGGASGLAYSNGLLFVADDNRLGATPENDRVMIFDTTRIAGLHDDLTNVTTPSPRCHLCGYSAVGVLGQIDYSGTNAGRSQLPTSAAGSFNQPVAVATDGHYFAVADANNNRVLLWNSVPTNPNIPPAIVLGQSSFTTFQSPQPVNANSLRGPQGVWIQNGKLFVADSGNYRVLVWNSIPTQNNQPADFALGQPNLVSAIHPPDSSVGPATNAGMLSNPSSVTSDGTHLFVADLGYNRVLIWNSIPTSNGQPADVVVGQPSMTTSISNNAPNVCTSPNSDSTGKPLYPFRCEATLSFPRYALAGGGKLFIADSGNDRVLVFNSIPTSNAAKADTVLGQPDFVNNTVSNVAASIASTTIDNTSAVDTIQAPTSLAFDGNNLYVADPYNRRVVLFTPGDAPLPNDSIVNWASEIIRQEGEVALSGTIVTADTVTVTVAGTGYTYTIVAKDTYDTIAKGLVSLINAGTGDPNVQAIFSGTGTGAFYLSSKASNLGFDSISLATSTSNTANLTASTSGSYLTAGTAATGAPGMLVEINAAPGQSFTSITATSPMPLAVASLPTNLGGVQVVVDGIPAPLLRVSPTQIVAQLPYTTAFKSSISVYVRTDNGSGVTSTSATPVYIAPANPGLFNAPSFPGQTRPWPAIGALHQLGNPSVVVSIDGSIQAKDVATITVAGQAYNYTIALTDTLATVRDGLVAAINKGQDPNVTATVGGAFNRVVLTARLSGGAGAGIAVTGTATTTATGGTANVSVTAYTAATCCDVPQGQPITPASPAVPNETIVLLGSGLGELSDPGSQATLKDGGLSYTGAFFNSANESVSATMNAVTAQVVSAGLPPFSYGIYYVQLIVPSTLTANATTPVYIAQNAYISNTVTIPVGNLGQVVTAPVTPPTVSTPVPPTAPAPIPPAVPTPITPVVTPPLLPGLISGSTFVVVSPASLVFTAQTAGNFNQGTQSVILQNPSGIGLTITGVSVIGLNAADFAVSQTCPSVLNAGSSCVLNVTYTPGDTGLRQASLVINTSAGAQTVILTGAPTSGFEIISQLTGKAIEVPGGSTTQFTKVVQAEVTTLPNQRWTLIAVSPGVYIIMNVQTGQVLDVTGGSTANFALIQQFYYVGLANQQWTLTPVDDGYYIITSVGTGKVLDLAGSRFEDGTAIQQYPYIGNPNQRWKFATFQSFQIQSLGTSQVLDVSYASTSNLAAIQEWPGSGLPEEQWFLVPMDATYYKIVNVLSHKSLDVRDKSNLAFALVQQYDFFGTGNQLWALIAAGNGSYAIVNKQSGMALDIQYGSSIPGTLIQQYNYFGFSNQIWNLVPAGFPGL